MHRGLIGVWMLALTACSSEGYSDNSTPTVVWSVGGLASPEGELGTARPNLCAVAMDCNGIPNEPKAACAVSIADERGTVYDGYAGVERRGRSSGRFPKANYSIEFRKSDGETNVPTDVLGMGKDEDWILDGMWADRSMMRNQLAYDLFASFGEDRYAAEGRYCTLVLDGKFRGIYRIVERPKRDGSRVDIPKDDGKGTSFVIGQDPDGELVFGLGLEAQWSAIYPNADAATSEQLAGVQTWLDGLTKVMQARTDDGALFEYLHRTDLVDWVLIQELSKNIDAYKLSVHLYKGPDAPARLIPWDMDLAFGQPLVAASAPEPVTAHESSGWVGERTRFIRDVIAVEGFAEDLAVRWRELRQAPLTDGAIAARLDGYLAAMQPELDDNVELWPLNEVTFAGIYPPYSFPKRDSYAAEVDALRTWISERLTWMDENIDGFAE